MNIFITTSSPHPVWESGERGEQYKLHVPASLSALSLQPVEGESAKRRQFPWTIRIKRSWTEGKGWKGQINYTKWIRNTGEKWRVKGGRISAGLWLLETGGGLLCQWHINTALGTVSTDPVLPCMGGLVVSLPFTHASARAYAEKTCSARSFHQGRW